MSRPAGMPGRFLRLLLVVVMAVAVTTCTTQHGDPRGQPGPIRTGGMLTVEFLDVGQGDAVLIRGPEGRAVLYDGGAASGGALEHLRRLEVGPIELVIASHPHHDHIGGLPAVIESYRPPFVLDNGLPHTTQSYEAFLRSIVSAGSRLLDPEARRISLDGVELTVIPPSGEAGWGLNNNSVGLFVEFGEFRMSLGGDAEEAQWGWWLSRGMVPAGPVKVHKASHHGSRNGDSMEAMLRLRPEIVVVGTSATNSYGHPHGEALALYEQVGARVLRTDRHGTVRILAGRDGRYEVRTEKDPERLSRSRGTTTKRSSTASRSEPAEELHPRLDGQLFHAPDRTPDLEEWRESPALELESTDQIKTDLSVPGTSVGVEAAHPDAGTDVTACFSTREAEEREMDVGVQLRPARVFRPGSLQGSDEFEIRQSPVIGFGGR